MLYYPAALRKPQASLREIEIKMSNSGEQLFNETYI